MVGIKSCTVFLFVILLSSVAILQGQSAKTYSIDASESNLWVFVGKSGLFSALAHDHEIGVKSFTGRVVLPKSGASGASLEFEIDTKSFVVLDKKVSDKDRSEIFNAMHNEVIESAKYQKITFKSSSVSNLKQTGENNYTLTLNGDLNLHGLTKQIAVPVEVSLTPQQLRATGKYTLKQTDYNIKVYSAGGGTVKVKNDVVINFNIVAKGS
ncbi:MAG: YceI family protein [Acidobacteria bacterium]|nr:YceI family protein [Acidobacteriota bacterium]